MVVYRSYGSCSDGRTRKDPSNVLVWEGCDGSNRLSEASDPKLQSCLYTTAVTTAVPISVAAHTRSRLIHALRRILRPSRSYTSTAISSVAAR